MHVLTVDFNSSSAPELFCRSLRETGFGVLSGHPIPKQTIETAYSMWQDFFAAQDKYAYTYQKPAQDGYFPFKTENAKDRKVSDLKEFYHYYPWGRIPSELKDISQKMYDEMSQLASTLLQWVEQYTPEEVSKKLSIPLCKMIDSSPNTLLRILHYPPLQGDVEDGAIRSAPHEDINLLTILPAATAPGLEVKDTHGQWHAVSCDPGNIVVNVGDMLQMCTEHHYKSTTHRVVNPTQDNANISRYSMPLFLHPRDEVKLAENYTAIDYRHERLRQIGIY